MPESLRPAYVGTLHIFMAQSVKARGRHHLSTQNDAHAQSYFQEELPRAAYLTLSDVAEKFDEIVIDEGQDLIRESYLDVLDICLKKGFARG